MSSSSRLGNWLREPLAHFIAIGFALFLVFDVGGRGGSGMRIVVSSARIQALAAAFAKTRQRPPTRVELEGLIEEYVREELATREAIALGIDADDTIIRRRLRQKLEFLIEDSADTSPPSDAELGDWLAAHSEAYRVEDRVAFEQVYLSRERRGDALMSDVERLLASLNAASPARPLEAEPSQAGDSIMLPRYVALSSQSGIAREFGDAFAAAVVGLEPGAWVGPVASAYGVHVVRVTKKEPGYVPPLEEVRPIVERDLFGQRRRVHVDAFYARLRERYRVEIERTDAMPDDAETDRGGRE